MPSHDDLPSLLSEFPAVPVERWRARAEQGSARLESRSLEGPTLEALYTAEHGEPGPRPPARAPGWRIGLEYGSGGVEAVTGALREDAARGLEAAWVGLHDETRAGARLPRASSGVVLHAEALPQVLAAMGPDVSLCLDAGVSAPGMVRALLEHRGGDGPTTDAVLCDVLATLAVTGGLGCTLDDAYGGLAQTTREAARHRPSLRTILVDAVGVHDAGASAEQEIAFAIAAGIEHLRGLESHGLSPAEAMPHLMLRMAAGGDLLLEVAKLRAAQRLWARVRAHTGADAGQPTPLWVRTSWRAMTRRDPWVNLLRGSVGGVAAVWGGASVLAVQPFTEALGQPTADARRWAINTQHILRGESYLGAVDDPAAGSWTFEATTEALAAGAWSIARGWLGRGGLVQALVDGRVQAELAERAAARSSALATGRMASTGTSAYPLLDEVSPPTAVATTPPSGVTAAPKVTAAALARHRPTEPFEALRDRSDAVTRSLGRRPRVALVTVGHARLARAQVDFARNLVTVGGFDPLLVDADAEPPDDVGLVILCGPAEALAEHGAARARSLVAAGTRVLVAGRPDDADGLRDAGVHDFVHRGRDVLALLRTLQADLLPSTPESDA